MAKKTFEEALAQLQGIVEELEKGDLALEKAIRKFEEGMKLSRYCSDCLDEAEARLTRLTESGEEAPFSFETGPQEEA
ncbi:exodeoxyribonuclease VII small subunit [Desulfobotulus sp.]|jgi:exodeoxyribonuclease VII small subunit|uniref:exodeoxyribonuclease VII small subunit n=1 Tax=Desulfobotulus sp. TaxID=1940337 RepID=UPI002A36F962|nr:exodeoxyribonuclease VII small subunit [Desulfobotulus sp.]MDY0161772.1 exodeoxyribonuclease VII small subunit [Desulfobotulus sp.]